MNKENKIVAKLWKRKDLALDKRFETGLRA